jgi:hypothetical protein
MRTYDQTEAGLAFQWVDNYFKLVDLIFQASGDDDRDTLVPKLFSEYERIFQELRLWFFKNQDRFIPVWSEFWHDKMPVPDSFNNNDGKEYFKNPFLVLYGPDNLCKLAFRLGVTEHIDTLEPTKQAVNLVKDITVGFSLEVLQFIQLIGEFREV